MSILKHAVSEFELPQELISLEKWTKPENALTKIQDILLSI